MPSGLLRGRVALQTLIIATVVIAGSSCAPSLRLFFLSASPQPIAEAPVVTESTRFAATGRLIYDLPNGKIWSMPIADDGTPKPLFRIPSGTFAFQPVWSARRQQVAYGYIAPDPQTGKLQNARPWVANLDGTNARPLIKPAPDFQGTYSDPAWSPNGDALWVTVQLPENDAAGVTRFRSEIRRIELSNGLASNTETVIIKEAHGPAISPNNRLIAYLAPENQTVRTAIWIAAFDGSGSQVLVAGEQFEEIYAPMRFSPDGRFLAFAAADAANLRQRTPQPNSNKDTSRNNRTFDRARAFFDSASLWIGNLKCACVDDDSLRWPIKGLTGFHAQRERSIKQTLTGIFGPRVAHAHGLFPADVWLVEVETGDLERLTNLSEDHPTPVWSPDGQYLAFAGVLGVYVINIAHHRAVRISDQGIDGQIEWINR